MQHRPQDSRVKRPVGDRARESRVATASQPTGVAGRLAEQARARSHPPTPPATGRLAVFGHARLALGAVATRHGDAQPDAEHRRGGRDRTELRRSAAAHQSECQEAPEPAIDTRKTE